MGLCCSQVAEKRLLPLVVGGTIALIITILRQRQSTYPLHKSKIFNISNLKAILKRYTYRKDIIIEMLINIKIILMPREEYVNQKTISCICMSIYICKSHNRQSSGTRALQ